jgi:valyl-tRNA synthetase
MDNPHRFRDHLEGQFCESITIEGGEKVRRLPSLQSIPTTKSGGKALDLIYHAAEVLRGIEDRASETEKHAKSIAERAIERLELAQRRLIELEMEKKAVEDSVAEAHLKIQQMQETLHLERLRAKAAEDLVERTELRAEVAETDARETKNALAGIEHAIRTQLLQERPRLNKSVAA